MRANGIAERYCTGEAPPYEKFLAWAKTVPHTLAQPALSLDPSRAQSLLRHRGAVERADRRGRLGPRQPATGRSAISPRRGSCAAFAWRACAPPTIRVDLADHHAALAASPLETARVSDISARRGAARGRRRRVQSHGPTRLPPAPTSRSRGCRDFLDALSAPARRFPCAWLPPLRPWTRTVPADHLLGGRGRRASSIACAPEARWIRPTRIGCAGYLLLFFGTLDARRGWTKQLHLGALRNVNTRMKETLGPRHRLRLDWRLAAGCSASPPISTRSTAKARCPG